MLTLRLKISAFPKTAKPGLGCPFKYMPPWTDSFLPGRATGHMTLGVQRVKHASRKEMFALSGEYRILTHGDELRCREWSEVQGSWMGAVLDLKS